MAIPPSTGKRHPIFARVSARISPAMDAQGALEHRRALLAGLPAGCSRSAPATASTSPTTRQRSPRSWPWSPSRICVPSPRPPTTWPWSLSRWSMAPPTPSLPLTPAWTLRSPPWCCARWPDQARTLAELSRWCGPVGSCASSNTSSRHRWPGPGPAARRPGLAHPGGRPPHQSPHPGRHHRRRVPDHQRPTVPVPRGSAAPAGRAPRPRRRTPPNQPPGGGRPTALRP